MQMAARGALSQSSQDVVQASEQLTGGGAGQRYVSGSAGVTLSSQLASWRSRRGVGLDITALPDMPALVCQGQPQLLTDLL